MMKNMIFQPARNSRNFSMNRKAISELIGYVLLIGLAIAMSGVIYAWLKFYVQSPIPEESCPEVSLVVMDYNCSNGILNLTVQNRGRFTLNGYTLKINNGTGDFSLFEINSPYNYVQSQLDPGTSKTAVFNFAKYGKIDSIETEAIRGFNTAGRPILCENSVARQSLENCR